MLPRPCLDCQRLHPGPGPRCPTHRSQRPSTTQRGLGYNHRRLARQVLAEEKHCHLCGQPARPGDPLTADHIIPRAHGGPTTRDNLRAAHASCNARRGARP